MFNFLLTATGTWALWKLLDRWVESTDGGMAGTPDGPQIPLDSRDVARELLSLGEPESAVTRAFSRIGAAGAATTGLPGIIEEAYAPLSREQRAAVSLALMLKYRTV